MCMSSQQALPLCHKKWTFLRLSHECSPGVNRVCTLLSAEHLTLRGVLLSQHGEPYALHSLTAWQSFRSALAQPKARNSMQTQQACSVRTCSIAGLKPGGCDNGGGGGNSEQLLDAPREFVVGKQQVSETLCERWHCCGRVGM